MVTLLAHFWHRSRRAWVPQTRDYLLTRMTDGELRMLLAQGWVVPVRYVDGVISFEATPKGRAKVDVDALPAPKRRLTAVPVGA